MKVAICFFGITRSLKYTIKSIENNILNIFKKNNIDYTIFMHTYHLNAYKNTRTNECTNNYDNDEYKLLNPDYIKIDDQEQIIQEIDMLQYRTHKDPWNTNYNSVNNFILAQYSKSVLINMIDKINTNYDYILFMRPDCLYIDKFNIDFLKSINDNTICIPNFHLYGRYNFNDRFCITNMKTYKMYGDVFKYLLNISKKMPLHSETVLGELMRNYKLNVIRVRFNFSRIRIGNIVVDEF
jgi:hypothetical protein